MPIGSRLTRGQGFIGALKVSGPLNYRAPLVIVTANTTLTAEDSGKVVVINAAATRTITLPAASTTGLRFTITHQVASTSGNGHLIDPAGTDLVRGNGFTPAAGKGAVCTQTTSRIGDSITLVSDGVSAWYIESVTGTWAREA
jgi:hypothetical protein